VKPLNRDINYEGPNFLFRLADICMCPNFLKTLDSNIHILLEVKE